jgi:hypothetical protein
MNQEWDIKPCSGTCRVCESALENAQEYMARLLLGESGYERADYCMPCWTNLASPPPSFSLWKGVFRKPAPPGEVLGKETAESLLRKLIEDKSDDKRNVIYVLAAMLERKRILVQKDRQTDDNDTAILVFEHKKSGEVFLVPDVQFHLDQLESVQEEVVAMLSGQESSPDKQPPDDGEDPGADVADAEPTE